MQLNPKIQTSPRIELIGQKISMNHTTNRIGELWGSFMPRLSEVKARVGAELYSLEVYPSHYFEDFSPTRNFEKWAAVPVLNSTADVIPDGMAALEIPEGVYAVFRYKGLPQNAGLFYRKIFSNWIPRSNYRLDDRPHFAVMGDDYKNNHPESEEDIWIPVVQR